MLNQLGKGPDGQEEMKLNVIETSVFKKSPVKICQPSTFSAKRTVAQFDSDKPFFRAQVKDRALQRELQQEGALKAREERSSTLPHCLSKDFSSGMRIIHKNAKRNAKTGIYHEIESSEHSIHIVFNKSQSQQIFQKLPQSKCIQGTNKSYLMNSA